MANFVQKKSTDGVTIPSEDGQKTATRKEIVDLWDASKIETFVVIPPDGGWGWIIVAAAFFTNFITDGVMYSFGLFLDDISKSLNCSTAQVALVNSAMTSCFFLSGPFISAFINRCGYRAVVVFGGFASSVFLVMISYSAQLSSLILYGMCCGISFEMIFLSSIIVVSFYFEKWRALAQSITSCGSSVGITCFPFIFGIIFRNRSWSFKFKILSLFGLLCSICGLFFKNLESVKIIEEKILPSSQKQSCDQVKTESEHSKLLISANAIEYPTISDLQRTSTVIVQAPKKISYTSVSDGSFSESVLNISSFSKSRISKIKMSVDILETVYEGREYKNPALRERCTNAYRRLCFCNSRSKQKQNISIVRPLNRDDIFYQGSLMTLPEYVKSLQTMALSQEKASLEYHLSVTRAVTPADIEQEIRQCVCFTESMKRSLARMLDFSVLKSKAFVLVSLSGLFTILGLYTPFMFLVDRAVEFGMDRDVAYHLITTIGVANTLGRITSGMASAVYGIDVLPVTWMGLTINSLAIVTSSWSFATSWQFFSAFIYGFSMGSVIALRPLVIVDIVGLSKLTNGFGISLVFQGIACLAGVPLSGHLKTSSNSYEMSFYFAGTVTLISAVLLLPVKRVHNRERMKMRTEV